MLFIKKPQCQKKNNKDLYMRGIKRYFNKMFKNDT